MKEREPYDEGSLSFYYYGIVMKRVWRIFFISIPCENPKEVCEELTKENLYLVPLKMGLRFAVCAVSKEKCMKAPKIIKDVIENLSQ